ncbi:MAG: site-2 protease family protein [Coriobacteriia bacterium]|nr:site-2 protease family protein [Coriobacteriia bacterium]
MLNAVSTLLLLYAVFTVHEYAHAWVADRLGDPTPRRHGRLTLNPLNHLDFWGSLALPLAVLLVSRGAFVLAYARPVRIRRVAFSEPRTGLALVGAAGPVVNLLVGLGAAVVWRFALLPLTFLPYGSAIEWLADGCGMFGVLSLFVGLLNLIPLPPADGSRIVQLWMPDRVAAWYLSNGVWITIGLVAMFLALWLLIGFDPLEWLIDTAIWPLYDFLYDI